MAHAIRETPLTPVDQVRAKLTQAEELLPKLDGTNVETFLVLLDEIEAALQALEDEGVDVRPERTRQESILNRLEMEPQRVVGAARRAGGLAKLRQAHPPAQGFWWHLDQVVRERQRRFLTRLLTILAGLALVGIGGYWLLMRLFPPDPHAVLMSEVTSDLQELAIQEDWQAALARIEAAKAQLDREDPELYVWESAVAERLGDTARAQTALERAFQLTPPEDHWNLWVTVGNVRLVVGDVAGAQAAAEQAQALAPDQALVYYLLGNVAEADRRYQEAIRYYEQAFELAQDTDPQLAAMSRVRLGFLLQALPAMELETPLPLTATPSP